MISSRITNAITRIRVARYNRRNPSLDCEMSLTEAVNAFPRPDMLYAYLHHYYRYRAPEWLRQHREYFKEENRGLGEDAFHAMWWLLFREFRPRRLIEIGVFRGQVISLWALIARNLGVEAEVHGVSPLAPVGDSVSAYAKNVDYEHDVLAAFDRWSVARPVLVRALSTDDAAVRHIASRQWDITYIDGSHDYDVVLADYRLCSANLAPDGFLIMDDASLHPSIRLPRLAFRGHAGPSRVARECADVEMNRFAIIGHNNVFRK